MSRSRKSAPLDLFAACAPGLEPLLAAEIPLIAPKARSLQILPGGVLLHGTAKTIMRLNLCSGLANRVLLRVGKFNATKLPQLRHKIAELPWKQLLGGRSVWQVRATSKKSRLYHTGAIAERVDEAIGKCVGRKQGASPSDGLLVLVRFTDNICEISLDTSGEPLHKRGWRQQTGKAPLREDLARALLVTSGWDRQAPLVDPMMGAGTIVIEAALMAANMAPGLNRSFAFEQTALHDDKMWQRVRADAVTAQVDPKDVKILGRDRLDGALKAALGNAKRAGVTDWLALEKADLRDTALPQATAWVTTNPPYGIRLDEADGALKALGRRFAALNKGASIALVQPAKTQLHSLPGSHVGLQPALMTDHGGTKVVLLQGQAR
jgi:putative N6-adenine-specific DNA methylase